MNVPRLVPERPRLPQSPDRRSMAEQLANMPDLYPEDDATPTRRPKKRKAGRAADGDGAGDGASESGTNTTGTQSDVSRRSSSPAKQINQLHTIPIPIVDALLSDIDIADLPESTGALFHDLERCHRLRESVPLHFKDILRKEYPFRGVWQEDTIFKLNAPDDADPKTARGTLEVLKGIAEQARELELYNELEAGWNSLCHGPLLILARCFSPYRNRIRIANVTSARIQRRLIPQGAPSSKMVDFAILLQYQDGDALSSAYRSLQPAEDNTHYFNHSSSQPTARNPMVISIETKQAGTGGTSAKLQLRVWAAAQMAWLAEVRRLPLSASIVRIHVPLLVAEGSQWSWFFAIGELDASTGNLRRTLVLDRQPIGDVKSLDGIFAVLEALRVLMAWMEDSWKPWLEQWLGVATTAAGRG
ncbi:hypothetical protein AC578_7766 [Pseudocercospora eumusae]|uniref:PD-(D/E)XK nuclease-like domain-containing protein n=1 Tax=Pseudocercospora eumusae TaxID=321146 RepID=A0A139H136_9PEZI|nr:hypothetical protein AC578_7766 [Pseudocercospora eumusae]